VFLSEKNIVILNMNQASIHNFENDRNQVIQTCDNPRGVGDFIDDLLVLPD